MFIHSVKYAFKSLIRSKENVFWALVFPIALATFMFMAFGKVFETTEVFKAVPIAVIIQKDNEGFISVVNELSKSGKDQLLDIKECDGEENAKSALTDGEIYGIIYVNDKISLTVSESGYNQTILKIFLEQYLQIESTISTISKEYMSGEFDFGENTTPEEYAIKSQEKIQAAVETINENVSYYKEVSTSKGNQDAMVTYFYAIFAMSCLFASFSSVDRMNKIQANTSSLGQRRALAPTHKMLVVVSEFIATEVIHFVIECITLIYMVFVLKIDFGDKYVAILLLLLVGSSIGVSIGMVIGALPKPKLSGKVGITISVSMLFSVLADLCIGGIRDTIEHTAPIINRINPAALIVDSFYALNVYDTYDRFKTNILILVIITAVLCTTSFLMVRRNRYASL